MNNYKRILNWKQLIPFNYKYNDVISLMNHEVLKDNRRDLDTGVSKHRPNDPDANFMVFRLQLDYNIVFDISELDDYRARIIDFSNGEKVVKKFSAKDAYNFLKAIIDQIEINEEFNSQIPCNRCSHINLWATKRLEVNKEGLENYHSKKNYKSGILEGRKQVYDNILSKYF